MNPDSNSNEKYSNVTESQNYYKNNNNKYIIESLVLPQSTLTIQPVFHIKTKYCKINDFYSSKKKNHPKK